MSTTPWFVLIMVALISTGGTFLGLVVVNRWKRRDRNEEINAAAEAKLEEFRFKLYERTDSQAKVLATELAECRARQTELYNQTLELRGKVSRLETTIEKMEAESAETRAELSDAGRKYLFLESAVDAAGLVLSPRGKLVQKTDSGEVDLR